MVIPAGLRPLLPEPLRLLSEVAPVDSSAKHQRGIEKEEDRHSYPDVCSMATSFAPQNPVEGGHSRRLRGSKCSVTWPWFESLLKVRLGTGLTRLSVQDSWGEDSLKVTPELPEVSASRDVAGGVWLRG